MHAKKRRKRSGGFGRVLLILLCLFLILVIGAAGFRCRFNVYRTSDMCADIAQM